MENLKARLQRALAATAARLVDDWKYLHRFFSVRLVALGSALLTAWQMMPDKVVDLLPHWIPVAAAYLTLISIAVGVAVKQDFKGKPPADGGPNA